MLCRGVVPVLGFWLLATASGGADPSAPTKTPYRALRAHAPDIPDPEPGSDSAEWAAEIRIGYFGPADQTDPSAGSLWAGILLAVEEANARGGIHGRPVRLLPAWSESPWQDGVADLARLIFGEAVLAVIGGIDGPSTHLAEQLAAKAHVPVVSPVATDSSIHLAGVPWVFSCAPGDHRLAPPLAAAVARVARGGPLVLLQAKDHDSHRFTLDLLRGLRDHQRAPDFHVQFAADEEDASPLAARAAAMEPGALILVADPKTSAGLVRALRTHGYSGPIFGAPAMARRSFLEASGSAADGAVVPLSTVAALDPHSDRWLVFAQAFETRFGYSPDGSAALAYDAASLVLAGIHSGGPDRARIARCIRDAAPYDGVSGPITWDPTGANTHLGRIGSIRRGRLVVLPLPPDSSRSGPHPTPFE